MGKVVRVANLGSVIDADQLKEIFSTVGNVVHVRLVSSPYSGESRGFGFVEMADEKQAADCIEKLNGKEQAGKVLAVTDAPDEKPKRAKSKAK